MRRTQEVWHAPSAGFRQGASGDGGLKNITGINVMDIAVLAIGVGFFLLMLGYVRVCEKL